jgi:hypothetical protein
MTNLTRKCTVLRTGIINSGSDENMTGGSANRQSIVCRVKSALGMNPDYSKMDLPLTETRPRDAIAAVDDSAMPRPKPENHKSDKSGKGFKFGIWRRNSVVHEPRRPGYSSRAQMTSETNILSGRDEMSRDGADWAAIRPGYS